MSAKLIKVAPQDEFTLKLFFNNNDIKFFNINNMLRSKLINDNNKYRWKQMFNAGDFYNYEVSDGDLIWPGWVEIFSEDLEHFIEERSTVHAGV